MQVKERETVNEPPLVIDVRTPGEFSEVHAPGSINIPLADIIGHADEIRRMQGNRSLHLMCRTDRRAKIAREELTKLGFTDVEVICGGITRWQEEGREVVRGKKGISIERQVRITAGSLVVLGVALSHFIHPGFIAISAFVGCGLIFAGITDTCGMAIMLGKLPFNRVQGAASCRHTSQETS